MDTVNITIDQLDKMSRFISDKLDYCFRKDKYPEFQKYYDAQLETISSIRNFMVERFATGIDSYYDLARQEPNKLESMLFTAKEVTNQIKVAQAKTKHYVKESTRAANFKGPEHLTVARENLAVWAKNSAEKNNTDSAIASYASHERIIETLDVPLTIPIKEKVAEVIASSKKTIGFTAEYNFLRSVFPNEELENHYTKAIEQSDATIKLLENIVAEYRNLSGRGNE